MMFYKAEGPNLFSQNIYQLNKKMKAFFLIIYVEIKDPQTVGP